MQYAFDSIVHKPLIIIILWLACLIFLIYLVSDKNVFSKNNKDLINKKTPKLIRAENNPIIKPVFYRDWETVGTFNPAAVKDDKGDVHIFYRAIGNDGVSRIGHARSVNGINFEDRSEYPIYVSSPVFGQFDNKINSPQYYDSNIYTSGGSWGGCEDPRAVVIDNRVYMTYTAFAGWESVRIALTSISLEDLKKHRWNWKKPKFISAPNEVNKNWVLFPEKINGKFAVLHSISPEIKIDYIDDVNYIQSDHIKSSAPAGGREEYWDNWMRGAGAPPMKTEIGWLLLYHAMDKRDPNKYKLGCMILDYKNPKNILYRSPEPILEPEMSYENDSKPGVVYASGSVILNDELFVYYGGGDKHVCVARTSIKGLLDWLVAYGKV